MTEKDGMPEKLFVVFDGPPAHESGRFIEVENENGEGRGGLAWVQRADGYWTLGPFIRADLATARLAAVQKNYERVVADADWSRMWAAVREIAPELVGGTDYWEQHTPDELAAEVRRRAQEQFHEAYKMTREANARLAAVEAERDEMKYALRTRPDYDFRCQRCGAPHNIDTSIPSVVWNQIVERGSPGGDKYGALCSLCIDDLLKEKGLACEAEFYFSGEALKSKLYDGSQGDVEYWQREAERLTEEYWRPDARDG